MAPPSGSNAAAAAAAPASYPSKIGRGMGGDRAQVSVSENSNAQEPLKMINSPPKTSTQPSLSQYSQSLSQYSQSPSAKSNLTAEQRERMEANRIRALERKRQKQIQMQRAEENRRRALATKEGLQRKRSAVDMSDNHAKKPRAENSKMDSSEATDADDLQLPPIQRTVDGVTLSEEQYQIVARARPPTRADASPKRHLIRITGASDSART